MGRHKANRPATRRECWQGDARTAHPDAASPGVAWARARALVCPPPVLSLSEWADRHFVLSPESSAVPGRWTCLPYQRGIMDAMTDRSIRHVTLQKSARVGYSLMLTACIGYHMHHDPCTMLVVQPTLEDARGFSREVIAPALRDVPVLASLRTRDDEAAEAMLSKRFPGGVLTLVGANSGAGFRRISRRVVLLDEVDAYPISAGDDGDPVSLATRRAEYYHDALILAGSTPLVQGSSRIEQLYQAGDRRRYFVPCPQCGYMDHLVFTEREGGGHWLQFNTTDPSDAHFVCSRNGCVITHDHKRDMLDHGEWRGERQCAGHASFYLWAAYSVSPGAGWADIATEFLKAKRGGREQLRTFVNTWLGETWQEAGEAPDAEKLFLRREEWPQGSIPASARDVVAVTCGVDVQRDRVIYDVVAWGRDKQSWSIDTGTIPCKIENEADWTVLDGLLSRTYPNVSGAEHPIQLLAIDSGDQTHAVYSWARRHGRRVACIKGSDGLRTIVGSPGKVDVRWNGKRVSNGVLLWPVGSSVGKADLYARLQLPAPVDGCAYPPGWVHLSTDHTQGYCDQITAEHQVAVQRRTGHTVIEWRVQPGRENHHLDAAVYARAAATMLGLDRIARADPPPAPPPPPPAQGHAVSAHTAPAPPQPPPPADRPQGKWISKGPRTGGWLRR